MQRAGWAVTAEAGIACLCPIYDPAERASAQARIHRTQRQVASPSSAVSVEYRGLAFHTLVSAGAFLADPAERPTRTARLAAVWSRIQSYAALGSDWAGPNTEAPSAVTILHARRVLDALPQTVDVPLVAASGDGEIVFTWLVSGDRIEASLDGEGYLSWACRISSVVSPGDSIDLANVSLAAFTEVLAGYYA